MPYGLCVVKTGRSGALVLALVIAAAACGGTATPTGTTATSGPATSAATATGTTASSVPSAASASFGQLIGSARTGEYKVTYKLSAAGAGEQSWYFKPPKARYDFSSNVGGQSSIVSIYSLPD